MKNITLKLIAAFLLSMGLSGLQAQEAILSASNNAIGNNGLVSYSVGQVAFITNAGTNGTITQGVQQPYEILFMEGIDNDLGIALKCVVYPNPADAYVILEIENWEKSAPGIHLSNLNGTLLKQMKITSAETKIPMDDLAPATYFLTVFEHDKAIQTYKIIKK